MVAVYAIVGILAVPAVVVITLYAEANAGDWFRWLFAPRCKRCRNRPDW